VRRLIRTHKNAAKNSSADACVRFSDHQDQRVLKFRLGLEGDAHGAWRTIPGSKTKNGMSHRVPLTPLALRIIDEMKSLAAGTGKKKELPSQFVFPSLRGNASIANPQKALEQLEAATGIEFRGHDFRRAAASMMAGMGVPRLVISKILNHVESGVTSIYDRHSYDREKQEELNAWGARLAHIVGVRN
jgi:integrase